MHKNEIQKNEIQILEDLARGFTGRANHLRRKAAKMIVEAENLERCSFDTDQAIEKLKDGMAKDEQKIIDHITADIEVSNEPDEH